jgi:hypothetical protein
MLTAVAIRGLLFLSICSPAAGSPAATPASVQYRERVLQCSRQELKFQLDVESLNPYDPADIRVEAVLLLPSGQTLTVPAFYWEAWDPVLNPPEKESAWIVRFTPLEAGRYEVGIYVSRRGGLFELLAEAAFTSEPSNLSGMIRRDGERLLDSQGNPFMAYGVNFCWGDMRDLPAYLERMRLTAAHEFNCIRVWLCPWWLPIEEMPGLYDQNACARLDRIMQQAESLGLQVILCIEQHGNFQPEDGPGGLWPRHQHPYNIANGGPCASPREFFSDESARTLFKNRLRYIVARWGYSASLLSWELFNEVELVSLEDGFEGNQQLIADWHREMSWFLRETDPHAHLISTSSDIPLQRLLAREGAVDVIQLHLYDQEDIARKVLDVTSQVVEEAAVPVFVGEFGEAALSSREAIAKGMAAAFSAGAAGALPWLQDTASPVPYLEDLRSVGESLEAQGLPGWPRPRIVPSPN